MNNFGQPHPTGSAASCWPTNVITQNPAMYHHQDPNLVGLAHSSGLPHHAALHPDMPASFYSLGPSMGMGKSMTPKHGPPTGSYLPGHGYVNNGFSAPDLYSPQRLVSLQQNEKLNPRKNEYFQISVLALNRKNYSKKFKVFSKKFENFHFFCRNFKKKFNFKKMEAFFHRTLIA
jgi:hypothetical protein